MRTVFKKNADLFKKMRTLAWVRILVPGQTIESTIFIIRFIGNQWQARFKTVFRRSKTATAHEHSKNKN